MKQLVIKHLLIPHLFFILSILFVFYMSVHQVLFVPCVILLLFGLELLYLFH